MKRILLSFCLIIVATTMSFAQANNAKTTFVNKAKELNTALAQNNADLGHTILKDINQLMMQEMGVTKMAIAQGATQAEKDAALLKNRQQTSDYSHVMNISNNTDIVANRGELKTTLEHFAGTY